jgi:homoserine acetyltransferase
MLHTWQSSDVSQQEPYNGDFAAAMKGIKAKALVLPAKTDLYFRKHIPPEIIPQTCPRKGSTK